MTERPNSGDLAMIRTIAESIATSISDTIAQRMPHVIEEKIEVPGPLKWAAGIVAAVMTVGLTGLAIWMVGTLNALQITVARIDERQQSQLGDVAGQFKAMDGRVSRLEEYHRRGGQ